MISWGGVGFCHRQSFQGNTMKKTLLVTALMLALSSTAMAIEISGQETVESEFKKPAYTNETINLAG